MENPTVGAGHTINTFGIGSYIASQFAAFSGVLATSPLDTQAGTTSGATNTIQAGSVTPSVNGCLIIAYVGIGSNTATATIDSGFTSIDPAPYSPGVNIGGFFAYLIQTTAAAVNPTWTIGGAVTDMAATIAVFKPAAGGVALPAGEIQLFPNPGILRRAVSLLTWTDPLKLELRGRDAFFGGAGRGPVYDYQNPRGPIPAATLRTWTNSIRLGQDRFFGLAGNPQHDWVNPRGAANLVQGWIESYKLALNGVPAPFSQDDWPNPGAALFATTLRTWIDLFKGQGTDTFFGLAGNPQRDWPTARSPTRSISLWTWTESVKLLLQGQDALPFAQDDWPNPRGAKALLPWADQYPLTLSFVVPPFGQDDWPVPRGAIPGIALRTWIESPAQGQDTFFGLGGSPQFSWPVPTAAAASVSLRTWTNETYRLGLVVTIPFMWAGWVNPPGATFATGLRTWLDPLKTNLQSQDGFFGLAGNPQHDWPVPAGLPPRLLRTWSGSLNLELQGKDRFFGLAGNPQHDWVNPRGAAPTPQAWYNAYNILLNAPLVSQRDPFLVKW